MCKATFPFGVKRYIETPITTLKPTHSRFKDFNTLITFIDKIWIKQTIRSKLLILVCEKIQFLTILSVMYNRLKE